MNTRMTRPELASVLIARCDVAGPRYTSYPTAPQFKVELDETSLCGEICASNEEPIPCIEGRELLLLDL